MALTFQTFTFEYDETSVDAPLLKGALQRVCARIFSPDSVDENEVTNQLNRITIYISHPGGYCTFLFVCVLPVMVVLIVKA